MSSRKLRWSFKVDELAIRRGLACDSPWVSSEVAVAELGQIDRSVGESFFDPFEECRFGKLFNCSYRWLPGLISFEFKILESVVRRDFLPRGPDSFKTRFFLHCPALVHCSKSCSGEGQQVRVRFTLKHVLYGKKDASVHIGHPHLLYPRFFNTHFYIF
ncbi:hypothetical protein Bca4012_084576 [Brassica carinata]